MSCGRFCDRPGDTGIKNKGLFADCTGLSAVVKMKSRYDTQGRILLKLENRLHCPRKELLLATPPFLPKHPQHQPEKKKKKLTYPNPPNQQFQFRNTKHFTLLHLHTTHSPIPPPSPPPPSPTSSPPPILIIRLQPMRL